MAQFKIPFHLGLVTSKGPNENVDGELREATGCFYKPGDSVRIHKILGRARLGDSVVPAGDPVAPSGEIHGLRQLGFDDGTNIVVVMASGGYYYNQANPENATSWTVLSGFDATAPSGTLHATHVDDRHYLVNSQVDNLVVEVSGANSDIVIRQMGMGPPTPFDSSDIQAAGQGVVQKGDGYTNDGFVNPENITDVDLTTFARSTIGANVNGSTNTVTISGFGTLNANAILEIDHRNFRQVFTSNQPSNPSEPEINTDWMQSKVTVEVSENEADWTIIYERSNWFAQEKSTYQVADGAAADAFYVRVTHYVVGESETGSQYNYQLYNLQVTNSGTGGGYGDVSKDPFSTVSGFYYGYYEYDSTRGLQGPAIWSDYAIEVDEEASENSVVWTLPAGGPVNSHADTYVILRTADGRTAPQGLAHLKDIKIPTDKTERPIVFDDFIDPDELSVGSPLYEMLVITQPDGSQLPFDLHVQPPNATFITYYQDSVVMLERGRPRVIRYSEPGLPESMPLIYEISKFPLPENDNIVAVLPLSRRLLILMEGACLYLNDLSFVNEETYSEVSTTRLEGQPGCVGKYAACSMSFGGEPGAAWVSHYGIHMTDGSMVARISDDLDWDALVKSTLLSTAVLRWDRQRQMLVFAYDSTGDGMNDRYILGHLNERHIKGAVAGRFPLPKWTGPHYGSINDWDQAEVEHQHRVYSAHTTDGNVYVEWSGILDESLSVSGVLPNLAFNAIPMSFKTGKLATSDYTDFESFKMNLQHTDWGTGISGIVNLTFERDQNPDFTGSVTKYPLLNRERGTEFHFGRSCETLQIEVQQMTAASGAFSSVRSVSRKTGKSGNR